LYLQRSWRLLAVPHGGRLRNPVSRRVPPGPARGKARLDELNDLERMGASFKRQTGS